MPHTARISSQLPAPGIQDRLLAWYDRHARRLPWRAPAGQKADPYVVWLSEVMLQQTTVVAVRPYFEAFLARWPRLDDLAAAPLDEVLAAWAGLGYYARARNLHKCAGVVAGRFGGRFPETEAALGELPGIGGYTAAAVAAIAFGRPAVVVDGNVERVVARLRAVETPLPAAKAELRRLAAELAPRRRPGDYAQAMMDLGATVCLPRSPKCSLCPIATHCAGKRAGVAQDLPRRTPKRRRPTRRAVAFWAVDPAGRVLLRRRPERGLLGGMMELPSTDWREAGWAEAEALAHAPIAAGWTELPGVVRHSFTHFHFEVTLWAGQATNDPGNDPGNDPAIPDGRWATLDELGGLALPSVMRKLVSHALTHGGRQ